MFIPINVNALNECVKIIKEHPEVAIPISSSFASSQLISKLDIVQDIERHDNVRNVCILAGWFCVGFKLLFTKSFHITSVDIDPSCKLLGKRMFADVNFITEDIVSYKPTADVIVNTSTEHINRLSLKKSFANILPNTVCYFQNNNINWYEDHINCFKTLDEFTLFLDDEFHIISAHEIEIKKPRYTGKRFSTKCIKKPTSA